jgi:outer membrane protein TolC
LSWNQIVSEAQQHNPDVAIAEKNYESARFQSRGNWSVFYPQLSATASKTYAPLLGSNTALFGNDSGLIYGTSLNLSQSIFAGFHDVGRVREGNANSRQLEATLQIAQAKLLYDLRVVFAQLLTAEHQNKLAEDILKRRQSNFELVDLHYHSGSENKGSVMMTRGLLHEAELDRAQILRQIDLYRRQLANLLGREKYDDLNVVGSIETKVAPVAPDFETLARATPEMRVALMQTQVSTAQVTEARSGFYPTLDLAASVGDTGGEWLPHDSHVWSVALTVNLPFFSGGKTYYDLQSARAQRQRADFNQDNVALQTLLKLRQAHETYLNLGQHLVVDQELLEAQSTRAMIARAKYAQSLMSFDDWDLVENDLIGRQKSILERRRDLAIAAAGWYQALGSTEGLE